MQLLLAAASPHVSMLDHQNHDRCSAATALHGARPLSERKKTLATLAAYAHMSLSRPLSFSFTSHPTR